MSLPSMKHSMGVDTLGGELLSRIFLHFLSIYVSVLRTIIAFLPGETITRVVDALLSF